MATNASMRELRREFGAYVRQARIARGLTGAELAALVEVSRAKLSRIELGQVRTDQATLDALAVALEIDEHVVTHLRSLRDRAESGVSAHDTMLASTHNYLRAFQSATEVWIRASLNIFPSPLQTDATVAVIFESRRAIGVERVARFQQVMNARLQARAELFDTRKQFRFIFSEEALLTPIYGLSERDHHEQIRHVLSVAAYDNVQIAMVPLLLMSHDRRYGAVDFTVFDRRRVSTDDPMIGFRPEISDDGDLYVDIFEDLWSLAVRGTDLTSLLNAENAVQTPLPEEDGAIDLTRSRMINGPMTFTHPVGAGDPDTAAL